MTLKAREAYWRARTRQYRRVEARQREKTMAAQQHLHELPKGDPYIPAAKAAAVAEKAKLDQARADVRRAQDALAKVRQQLAGAVAPTIVTAEQIGLGFTYPFGLKGTVYRGAGHYSAGRRAKNKAGLVAEMRSDHRYHASKGWGGLSYEYMIADDGTLGLGSPVNRKAAAVAFNNTGMVGICCPGTTGDRMTAAQKATVKWLLANAHTSKLPKAHRLPKSAKALTWRGHREWPQQSTACPGLMLGDYKEVW